MKKIFITILILFVGLCYAGANNTKIYLVRNYEYYYDLNTFKYDLNGKISIDVVYNIDPSMQEKRMQSPYDKNYIQYLIFTTHLSKNNTLEVDYKGFVTGIWELKNQGILFKKAKIYYNDDTTLILDLDKYIEDFKNCAILVDYKKDIMEILQAYKNNAIQHMDGIYSTLNRYNDI